MSDKNTSGNGKVNISEEVIAQYAGNAAMECFGIVGIGAVRNGLAKILRSDKLSKGISVSEKNGKLTIDFHVIVAYFVSIPTVCDNLIHTVEYQVENFTGMEVEKINVFVEGVRYIG